MGKAELATDTQRHGERRAKGGPETRANSRRPGKVKRPRQAKEACLWHPASPGTREEQPNVSQMKGYVGHLSEHANQARRWSCRAPAIQCRAGWAINSANRFEVTMRKS